MTKTRLLVHKFCYRDSAFLMRLGRELSATPGVVEALALMATPMNRALLAQSGFSLDALGEATPLDLLVAVRAADETALDRVAGELSRRLLGATARSRAADRSYASLAEATEDLEGRTVVCIAVPGEYAAHVARRALHLGRDVFLFSNNVPLEEEISLKRLAAQRGLLLMGPDCGTAILAGVGLGFANRVRAGNVGLVGASGTGLQEVMCALDRHGAGVSHAIGTGSRDLSSAVAGSMSARALDLLSADPATAVIALVGKHPADEVAAHLHAKLAGLGKPAVVRFLGQRGLGVRDGVVYADNLDEVARVASTFALGRAPDPEPAEPPPETLAQGRLVGLFGGGSLAAEAALLLEQAGLQVRLPDGPLGPGAVPGEEHLIVDTGEDFYTAGRPHPMVDQSVRCRLLRDQIADPRVAVVLFDLVLCDGAHPDPAPELKAAIAAGRAARGGQPVVVIASITGTDRDPQGRDRQRRVLLEAGVQVALSAARAARLAIAHLGVAVPASEPVHLQMGAPRPESPAEGRRLDPVRAVVHLGLAIASEAARAAGVPVREVDFRPPAGGDPELIAELTLLEELAPAIDRANELALAALLRARPALVGIGTAREVIPGMSDDLFLHAGPPIGWERMCGPLRGAVIGGLLLEGFSKTPEEAARMAQAGRVRFEPCHHHQAVGPMAGLVTPSMPVWIVQDGDRRTFCTLNEGLGRVLRYGAFGPEVLERLRFMAAVLAPALQAALQARGPIDLVSLFAQALQMGDEGHNRNRAATSLLFRELAPALVRTGRPAAEVGRVLDFLHQNDHTALNLSMPMAKCMLLAAEGQPLASLLTVMARNGTEFGIQLAGLPGRWFTGPAQPVRGLYFPGFAESDANPDIGDSAITETAGLGAFAMAAAPAIVQFVGGSAGEALETTCRMAAITAGRNPAFAVPALDFAGVPCGIDVRRVVELSLLPVINTGIAHREPGIGQIGAGITAPPWECFHKALEAFHKHAQSATIGGQP